MPASRQAKKRRRTTLLTAKTDIEAKKDLKTKEILREIRIKKKGER